MSASADQVQPEPSAPTKQVHNRPAWTLTEAAQRCSVSRSTLRRRLAEDSFPSAWKDGTGQWRIPLGDLLAAGLAPARPAVVASSDQVQSPLTGLTEHAQPRADSSDVAQLKAALTEQAQAVRERDHLLSAERARANAAERAAALMSEHLSDVRAALRMLEAGRASPSESLAGDAYSATVAQPAAPPARTRRRWWQRG